MLQRGCDNGDGACCLSHPLIFSRSKHEFNGLATEVSIVRLPPSPPPAPSASPPRTSVYPGCGRTPWCLSFLSRSGQVLSVPPLEKHEFEQAVLTGVRVSVFRSRR